MSLAMLHPWQRGVDRVEDGVCPSVLLQPCQCRCDVFETGWCFESVFPSLVQLEGAVTGENGFAADDVLRLNRSAKPLLASIAEDGAPAEAAGALDLLAALTCIIRIMKGNVLGMRVCKLHGKLGSLEGLHCSGLVATAIKRGQCCVCTEGTGNANDLRRHISCAGSEGTCTPLSGDAQGEAQAPRPPGGPAGMRDSMALFLQVCLKISSLLCVKCMLLANLQGGKEAETWRVDSPAGRHRSTDGCAILCHAKMSTQAGKATQLARMAMDMCTLESIFVMHVKE